MKSRSRVFSLLILLTTLFLVPARVLACACCADDGEYGISFSKPSAYQLGLLEQIRFGETATVFTNAAGFDAVRGLSQPKESYSLKGALSGSFWQLVFRDGGRAGTLSLPLPARMLRYRADIHDGQTGGAGGPLLYKEWRFEGQVSGSGFFRAGITAPTKYFLVLQGRGNNCDNAEDFTHWRLEVTGRRAAYAFFGELAKPAPDSSAR